MKYSVIRIEIRQCKFNYQKKKVLICGEDGPVPGVSEVIVSGGKKPLNIKHWPKSNSPKSSTPELAKVEVLRSTKVERKIGQSRATKIGQSQLAKVERAPSGCPLYLEGMKGM